MSLSGPEWVKQFPTSSDVDDLDPTFAVKVRAFLDALVVAKARVRITATRRPPQRAYLMHYAWCIARQWHGTSPASVPAFVPKSPREPGVEITWLHRDSKGLPDFSASKRAAQAMVNGYQISRLHVPPALRSLHIEGKALDMAISWSGTLDVADASGKTVTITSAPRDGTNADLIKVGASYGVIHLYHVQKDPVHWSVNGH
jgi:hypothetical protein